MIPPRMPIDKDLWLVLRGLLRLQPRAGPQDTRAHPSARGLADDGARGEIAGQ